jgi:hypothetical protein
MDFKGWRNLGREARLECSKMLIKDFSPLETHIEPARISVRDKEKRENHVTVVYETYRSDGGFTLVSSWLCY